MGGIEADIVLESWLFRFRPCSALLGTGTVYPICFNFTHRISRACLNHSQEPYEWVILILGVPWVEPEQKLNLKVGCSNFGLV